VTPSADSNVNKFLNSLELPELGRTIGEVAQKVDVNSGKSAIHVQIELGFPAASRHDEYRAFIADAIRGESGIDDVTVELETRIVAHGVQRNLKPMPGVRNIIAVASGKGGVGKSTIATSIASYYASQGKKVVLVDCDPQASSLEWLAARPSGRSTITGIDGSAGQFRAPRSADYVVYDTPAAVHGKELSAFLRRAQSIIIPVLPSPIDMRAATPFIQSDALEIRQTARRVVGDAEDLHTAGY